MYICVGTATYYTRLAETLCRLIGKCRSLVYMDGVKYVAPMAIALQERGISSSSYHGKNMSSHDKVSAIHNWCPSDSTVQVMVCTTAFGMGVDVPDVELITRVGCPSSLEELVQEFGRGGRDGRQAEGKSTCNTHHNIF